tara:strand:- start:54 stop:821 length:768 start_codon:yes stop_codon:yes gene_type:complete
MLFGDIPKEFNKDCKKYFKKIFSNFEKFDDHLLLNGISAPLDIKTDHMKLEIGSTQHIDTMIELYYLLYIFHQFSQKNNILYTISSGNLLGYHSNGEILLWDDDIDIIVTDNHFKILKKIWEEGGQACNIWDGNWSYKKILIENINIILLRLRNSDFFKIKLNTNKIGRRGEHQRDIGGIDICTINWVFAQGGQTKQLPKHIKNILSDPENQKEKDYPVIKYGPVETRILREDLSIMLLDIFYPRWRDLKHPALL